MATNTDLEVQKLFTEAIIPLYVLDLTALSGDPLDVIRFVNYANTLGASISFDGETFTSIPILASDFGTNINNSEDEPKVQVADFGKIITSILAPFGMDIAGAVLSRTLVFRENLDDGSDPDPESALPSESYIIENHESDGLSYSFVLGNSLNWAGASLIPRRRIRQIKESNNV